MIKPSKEFNDFCINHLPSFYNPELDYNSQCNGYKQLWKMIYNKITPSSPEEIKGWEKLTEPEITEIDYLKNLRFLHENLRSIVSLNWDKISRL